MDSDHRPRGTYLIADVSALTGVTPARLRSWERAGLLRPARSGTAVRVYPAEEVARARLIRRSLDNPGRRGSLRRLAERLEREGLEPEPDDWAGLAGTRSTSAEALPDVGWQSVVDALPAPVAVWDDDGALAHANPALGKLLGVDDPVAHPAAASALTGPGTLSPRWVARVGATQRDVRVDLGPDGQTRETVWRIVPVVGPDAAPRGAVALGHDATEREVQVREREGRLAEAVGELRAPLGVVLGNLQLANRVHHPPRGLDKADRDRLARHLQMAEAGAREVLRRLDTLLDATAAAGGGLPAGLEAADLDLGAIARAAVDHAAALTSRHSLRLSVGTEPVPVVGDANRLREVVDNLLANAVAFSPDGGPIVVRVEVDVEPERPRALLRVADEGIGIRTEDVPRVFERYHRGSGINGAVRGAGLGLFAARALATAHGGELWIERTAVRGRQQADDAWHGTVVALALPLARGAAGAVPIDQGHEGAQ